MGNSRVGRGLNCTVQWPGTVFQTHGLTEDWSETNTTAMSEDKHFNEGAQPVPPALEDHKPSDAPAARSMMAIIGGILALGALVATVLYYTVYKQRGTTDPVENVR